MKKNLSTILAALFAIILSAYTITGIIYALTKGLTTDAAIIGVIGTILTVIIIAGALLTKKIETRDEADDAPNNPATGAKAYTVAVTHDVVSNEGEVYTFRSDRPLAIGELVRCNTRRGPRLGRVVSISTTTYAKAKAYAKAERINPENKRFKGLKSYDRATYLYNNGATAEDAMGTFHIVGDIRAIEAWMYNILNADYVGKSRNMFNDVELEAFDGSGNTIASVAVWG